MSIDVLVVGGGYSGRRVAERLIEAGQRVVMTRRSAGSGPVPTIAVDLDDDALDLSPCRRMLFLVPPGDGAIEPRLARVLAALPETPERVVLTSTSGVYGDCDGALVDEDWPVRPGTDRARRRVNQERTLCAWASRHGTERCVLRVAGIYGPGRMPVERLAAGEPVLADAEAGPGNRIHVDDLATVMIAALERDRVSPVYNVSDGNHASSTAFYRRVAELAGLEPPKEIDRREAERTFGAMRLSFMNESRRLVTDRLRRELEPEFRYLDLDAGIRASLEAD